MRLNLILSLVIALLHVNAMKRARGPTDDGSNSRHKHPDFPAESTEPFLLRLPSDLVNFILIQFGDIADIPAFSQTCILFRSVCHEEQVSAMVVAHFMEHCNLFYSSGDSLDSMSLLIPFVQSYMTGTGLKPLLPKLLDAIAGYLAAAYNSSPLNCFAFRLLPLLDIQYKKTFQCHLINRYEEFSEEIEYLYEHKDLFGACCRLSLRTELDLYDLYGPLLLGSGVEDQAFILLWAFNLIDLGNKSLSVVVPLLKLQPFMPYISNALKHILDLLSLAFPFLAEDHRFQESFTWFFRKTFNMELPSCTEANLVNRLDTEPNLMFSILEVIQATQYFDHTRVKHRLEYFHQKCASLSPVYYKCVCVLEIFSNGKTCGLPFTCGLQEHLYKMVWLSMNRSSKKMVTPLQLCIDPSLGPAAREWIFSTILMLSPDMHVCRMAEMLQLDKQNDLNWLEIFPSANGIWTFFSLVDRLHDEDVDTILDFPTIFSRILDEFRVAL